VLGVFIALALLYNVVQPPFEPSDEQYQFGYVRYLVEQRALPVARAGELSGYHHPPLYFALAAALSWPFPADDLDQYPINPYNRFRHWEPGVDNKNLYVHGPWDQWPFHGTSLSLHAARLASLALGAVVVILTYQVARRLLDETASVAAAALAAFIPQFLSLSGALQNDAGAAMLGAVSLWLGLCYIEVGFTARRALLMGALVGLAGLMKLTAAFLIVPAVLSVWLWGWSQPGRWVLSLRNTLLIAAGVALSSGWWYVRNWLVYGDPTAVNINLANFGGQSFREGLATWPAMLPYAWTTFWARIGHGDVAWPEWVYTALALVSLGALLGLVIRLRRLSRAELISVIFLGSAGLAALVSLLYYITVSPTGGNSRYTFPALPAYMTLMLYGLTGPIPQRTRVGVAWASAGMMALFGALTLALYLYPAYTPPPALSQLPSNVIPLEANLGDTARLRGYSVSPKSARPGDRVYLTVYWEPLSPTDRLYSVYVHLLNGDGTLVAQRDTYPGLGRYPTTAWQPGRLFADPYLIIIPEDAPAPATAHWKVGLWQTETGDYAFLLGPDGQPVDSGLTFGQLTIEPGAP
jgi:4-amino-4-deoxy-L-arabinose transferase-like glycosyltransferase